MAEIKFITEENLNTFAKFLKLPENKSNINITKFTLVRGGISSVTINDTNINLIANEANLDPNPPQVYGYGYGSDYGYGYGSVPVASSIEFFNDEYYCAIKTDKNCILYFLTEDGEYSLLDCEAGKEQIISFDDNEKEFTMFFIANYNTI